MPSRGSAGGAVYMAWDTNANAYKTGDVANHTIRFVKDAVEATPTNSPTEVDSTNAPGAYLITWTSAEGTCNTLWIGGKSATASVYIVPITIGFENLPVLPTTILTVGSGVNVTQINGSAVLTSSAQLGVNIITWAGDPVTFPPTTGYPPVDAQRIAGAATASSLATGGVNVNQWLGASPAALSGGNVPSNARQINGTATVSSLALGNVNVVSFNGASTATSLATGSVNLSQILGAAVVTSSAQIGVNVVSFAGNPQGVTNIDRSTRSIALAVVSNQSTTTNIFISTVTPSFTTDSQFVGRIVNFDENTTTANLRGQSTNITAGNKTSSGGNLSVTALTDAPVFGDTFTIT